MPLDNQKELFYWVDENDQVLGKITRGEAHSGSNKIHRAASVFVFSPNDQEVLLQKRSLKKDMYPGYWADSVGGHLEYGQSYEEAAIRETQEELGLSTVELTFHSHHLFNLQGEREFFNLFITHIPKDTPIHFDKDEIQQVKWVPIKNLPAFFRSNLCTQSLIQCWEKIQVGLPV